MNIERIKHLIDNSQLISFDVFDTLLKRNVFHPQDVFVLIEQKYNARHQEKPLRDFCRTRIEAECQARRKSNREDITLDLIYQEMPFEEDERLELKGIECEVEKDVSICHYPMKEVYDYAILKGKKVVAVSEMYLPKDFIYELLHNAGYHKIDRLYVSSETGKMKKSGSLFRLLIKDYGIEPKKILHIGDAKRSDWIAPKLLGMHSYRIKTHYSHTTYLTPSTQLDINERTLYGFINNNLPGDTNLKLGFETFGPLLWGLCFWIHSFVQERHIKRILFLARDGQIMEKVYRLMYPDDITQYIYVSRRALTVPPLHLKEKWEDVVNLIPQATHIELHALLERLGLDLNDHIDVIRNLGLNGNEIIAFDKLTEDSRFEHLYKLLKPAIDDNSRNEYEACKTYFKGLNLQETECIVDLGWKGTIQKALETLLPLYGINTHLEALYLGITLDRPNAHGYVYSPKEMSKMLYVRGALGLIETLFSSNHGTLIKYGEHKPILDKFEYENSSSTRRDYQTICQIQEGALSFVKAFKENALSDYIQIDVNLAFKALKELCINPKNDDLEKLGNLSFFDTEVVPLAKPLRRDYFSLHSLKYSFSHSHWKYGYLRRFFKLPLPYLAIYKMLRKLYVK